MERLKRPLAILCLILMGILIVGAVVLALIGTERSARLLMADLFFGSNQVDFGGIRRP